jgi:hypothetical protein
MNIKVLIENVYGTRRIYPACENAKAFADIAGTTTLTPAVIAHIKKLGYTVEVIQQHDFL